jgi:hypothetical protein
VPFLTLPNRITFDLYNIFTKNGEFGQFKFVGSLVSKIDRHQDLLKAKGDISTLPTHKKYSRKIFYLKILLKLKDLCKIMNRGLNHAQYSKDERCIYSDSWSFLSASP